MTEKKHFRQQEARQCCWMLTLNIHSAQIFLDKKKQITLLQTVDKVLVTMHMTRLDRQRPDSFAFHGAGAEPDAAKWLAPRVYRAKRLYFPFFIHRLGD